MKARTREKLAARGLGPLVRPGRPGRGKRGALASSRGVDVAEAAVAESPAVSDEGPLGAFVVPSSDSVRQRVRLRPVVREALDLEAARLGMSREGFCRVVLEEVARKVAVDSLLADSGVDAGAEASTAATEAGSESAIPLGYVEPVGASDAVPDQDAALPPDRGFARGSGAGVEVERALRPTVPESAAPSAPRLVSARFSSGAGALALRAARRARRLRWAGGRVRLRRAWVLFAGLGLLAVLIAAAAATSWRYELVGTGGDGVYVVDRWRGAVWRCGPGPSSRSVTCGRAVFGSSPAAAEVVSLGGLAR